ncbi:MAG: ROK family protein [Alphaproteobacteria bacterium]
MNENFIGIDVGGTNIKIALVNDEGIILYQDKYPTEASKGYETSCLNIKNAIKKLLKETQQTTDSIKGIGIGFPGVVDNKNGTVKYLANMPGWEDINIASQIKNEFGLDVKLENDANCAAIAEWKLGAGENCKDLVCITIGTGIGGGIVVNNKIVRGFSGTAGELGHIKVKMGQDVKCGCGDYNCLEAFASGPAIIKMAQEKKLEAKNPYEVFKLAKNGNKEALQIFETVGEYIGFGLCSVINLLNPQKIIIGGGVAEAGDLLFEPIKKIIKQKTFPGANTLLEVIPAQLGNDAGVLGASLLFKE